MDFGVTDIDCSQLLLVKHTGGSDARVEFYTKDDKGWTLLDEGSAFIGKNGTGKESEGDGKTPLGELGVRRAFGLLPDPGTSLEYLQITENTYACDADCEYYNQIVDSEQTGCTLGEHMCEFAPAYNYGIETDFNDANVYPAGSAIFLHCKSGRTYTGGCIAVDEELMKKILIHADRRMRIRII